MSMESGRSKLLAAALVALGLATGGALIGRGLEAARTAQRFVTVRGLSEQIVRADLVIWPVVFSAADDDLEALQASIDRQASVVQGFLSSHGIAADEWRLTPTRITAQQGYGANRPEHRYLGEATIAVRSPNVELVQTAIEESGELVRLGVAMVHSYEFSTEFLFTSLESVKPQMIAEATRDARRGAQQFADDSGSRVGAIRRAQQGYFSIADRDAFSHDWKKVRVVTTVEYFLVGD